MRKNHNRGDHIVGIGRRARMADLRGWHLRAHAWLMGVGGTCRAAWAWAEPARAAGAWAAGRVRYLRAPGDARSRTARMGACVEALGGHGGAHSGHWAGMKGVHGGPSMAMRGVHVGLGRLY